MYDAETLRLARTLAGLSQAELGERIGGGERSVQRWERQGLPTRSTARTRAVERELGLTDPTVLRAIQRMRDDQPITIDPDTLSDTALTDLITVLVAEMQNRLKAQYAAPERLHGQHAPYPEHLYRDAPRGETRNGHA